MEPTTHGTTMEPPLMESTTYAKKAQFTHELLK
jgi:hypothetical protein